MKIIATRPSIVEIEDDAKYRSSVFLQGNGRWKCLRCDRLTCEHVKWVAAQNVELPKIDLSNVDFSDIIDD